jgi:hypothetical protein
MQSKRRDAKQRKRAADSQRKHMEIMRRKAIPPRRVFVGAVRGQMGMGRFVTVWPRPKKRENTRRERMSLRFQKKGSRKTRLLYPVIFVAAVVILSVICYFLLIKTGKTP